MIGNFVGTPIGGVLDTVRVAALAATETADTAAFSAFVFSIDLSASETPDTAVFTVRAVIPFVATPSIGGGRGKGPVSAGRATSGVSGGSGKSTIGR